MELSPSPGELSGDILVITGERGAGKTTYCRQMIDQCRSNGLNVAGLLSPGRIDNSIKTGIFAEDLKSGDSRLLASSIKGEIEGIRFGCWDFDPRVLEWGNQVLKQTSGTDLLVIDELGPLEFERRMGWVASFDLLKAKQFGLAMVVIRPECLASFSKMGFAYQVEQLG